MPPRGSSTSSSANNDPVVRPGPAEVDRHHDLLPRPGAGHGHGDRRLEWQRLCRVRAGERWPWQGHEDGSDGDAHPGSLAQRVQGCHPAGLRGFTIWLVVGGLTLLGPAPGWAAGGAAAQAKRYAKQGKKALKAGRIEDALAAYEAAYESKPVPKYLLSKCHERAGDLPQAIEWLERFLQEATKKKRRIKAETRLGILRGRLRQTHSRLEVDTDPAKGLLRITPEGGAPMHHTAPFDGWLAFGPYSVAARRDGRLGAAELIHLERDRNLKLMLTLAKPPAPAPTPPETDVEAGDEPAGAPKSVAMHAPPDPPPVDPGREPGSRWLPWVLAGSGVALLAAGVLFGKKSAESEERMYALGGERVRIDDIIAEDEARRGHAVTANILYGAGAVGVSTALVLALTGGGP